jgi:D-alanyl-D-alanine carboxypeptidase
MSRGMLLYMSGYHLLFSKQLFLYGISSIIFLGFCFFASLSFIPQQQPQVHEDVKMSPPVLTTDVWGVFDVASGEVIIGDNIDTVRPIASITKLFTGEAVLKSAKKGEKFWITYSDIETEGRAGKLQYGEYVSPYELLYPLLLESSNDAGHAIQRYLGEEYMSTISSVTSSLGLSHTVIYDGSGLSPRNVSTVRELATYYVHVKQEEPHLLDITQVRTFITDRDGYLNNNPARGFDSFRGGKHGFTDEAGRTFVGSFITQQSTREVGVILLGSNDLRGDIDLLKNYGESILNSSDILSP